MIHGPPISKGQSAVLPQNKGRTLLRPSMAGELGCRVWGPAVGALGWTVREPEGFVCACIVTLRLKITPKPYIILSLGPKTLKPESLEP